MEYFGVFLLLHFELVPSEPNDINKTRLIQVSRGNSSFPQIRVRNRKLFFLFLNQKIFGVYSKQPSR